MESHVYTHLAIIGVLLFVGLPIAVTLLEREEKFQRIGIFVSIALIVLVPKLGLQFMADHEYVKGTTQGFDITYLDFFALAYTIILLRKNDYRFDFFPPGTLFFIPFLASEIASCVNSPNILYSEFEIFRLVKMGFFYCTLYNILVYYNCFSIFVNALGVGILMNLITVIFQKYLLGLFASSGLMRNKNNAGMYSNMLMPLFMYIILNMRINSKIQKGFYVAVFLGTCMVLISTLSRGAWAVAVLNFIAIFTFSLLHGITRQKIMAIVAAVVVTLLGVIKAYDTIYERITVGNVAGTHTRVSLVYNALDMAEKNFFGVGINNYTEANTYENNYGGVFDAFNIDKEDVKIGKVETVYLLTAAECGWIGLFCMLAWFFYYLGLATLNIFYFWKSNMAYLAVGMFVALAGTYLHSLLEWSLRNSQIFYMLTVLFALTAALSKFRHDKVPRY